MEKLELKHLAPYLPYGLMGVYTNTFGEIKVGILTSYLPSLGFGYDEGNYDSLSKPILKPLSDIKNFEDIMDEFSEYSWEAFENHFFDYMMGRSLNCFDNVNYTIVELCFKHHLDIFGLIDKGLAISYSDVQATSNEG